MKKSYKALAPLLVLCIIIMCASPINASPAFTEQTLDIAKSETVQVVEYMHAENGELSIDLIVEYTLRGTIYYNPNTYEISSVLTPRRSNLKITPQNTMNSEIRFGTAFVSSTVPIAGNKLSATFNHSNRIVGQHDEEGFALDFGYIDTTFTIGAG